MSLDPKDWSDAEIETLLRRLPLSRMETTLQEAAREEVKRREAQQAK